MILSASGKQLPQSAIQYSRHSMHHYIFASTKEMSFQARPGQCIVAKSAEQHDTKPRHDYRRIEKKKDTLNLTAKRAAYIMKLQKHHSKIMITCASSSPHCQFFPYYYILSCFSYNLQHQKALKPNAIQIYRCISNT